MGIQNHIELAQKQTVSEHLVQSMQILQMDGMELEEYVERLALENPVIDLDERTPTPDESLTSYQWRQDWLRSTDMQNRIYYQADGGDGNAEEHWQDIRYVGESLADFLLSQIILDRYTKEEQMIIEHLIYSLDDNGYYRDDPKTAAAFFGASEHTILHYLQDIQCLDPAGVGARDLRECLVLQLKRKDNPSKITETVILFYLEDVAKNLLPGVAKKMGVPLDDIVASVEEIRAMNPKPGNSFSDRENLQYIRPDALVVEAENGFNIILPEYRGPRISLNGDYLRMAKSVDDPETKQYLKEKIHQAKSVSSDIAMRGTTIFKVIQALVDKQQPFFHSGQGYRRPMSLSDLSAATGLHESTISRALRGKYLQCAWGVFPLNYFLTAVSATSAASGEQLTQEQIQAKMREIINSEDKKKPLSDEEISRRLKDLHINISRRTVNKYRQLIGIPGQNGRKQF